MPRINLADAIADAKNLKETAIANAKIQLEETFTPTLQRLVSSRIQEEEGDDEDIDIDLNIGEEGEGEDADMGFDSFESDEPEEDAPAEGGEEDMELESLMRELDGEDDEMMEGEDFEDDDMMEGEDFEDDMMEGEEEDWQDPNPEAIQEGDYDEEELEEALQAVLEMDGLGDDLDMGQEDEDGSAYTENPPSGPQFLEVRRLRNEVKRLQQENRKLKGSLNESLRGTATLKKTINEVNLLNAKLMYFTKTQRKFNLNEAQEARILNSFDRANTVREVKLVYTTVCESFNKRAPQNQGFASKTVRSVKPTTNIVNENFVDRMQRLANIKKLND